MIRFLSRTAAAGFITAAVLMFSGCASLEPTPSAAFTEKMPPQWRQHERDVRAQTDWMLSARITANTEDDGWNGKLYWQQDAERYQISFTAPFGQGGLQLDGGPQQVELRTSDGQVMVAADAESLLYEQMGWRLPLHNLRYWVRGIPVPSTHKMPRLAFDQTGRLARLQQAHWDIEYLAYRQVDGLELPRKVYLENTEFNMRLVIDRWGFGTSDSQ